MTMTVYVSEIMVKRAARRHQHPAASTTTTAVPSCCDTAAGKRLRRRVHWPLDTTEAVDGLSMRIGYPMASHSIGRQEAWTVSREVDQPAPSLARGRNRSRQVEGRRLR